MPGCTRCNKLGATDDEILAHCIRTGMSQDQIVALGFDKKTPGIVYGTRASSIIGQNADVKAV